MIKSIALVAALVSLMMCLAAPALYVAGTVEVEGYKTVFLIASLAWFVAATVYDAQRQRAVRAADDQR